MLLREENSKLHDEFARLKEHIDIQADEISRLMEQIAQLSTITKMVSTFQ